eukprot:TRINITY_DN11030_c0_g1_i2.p1 TRINITY_DN11030_c0_g1~~TRINITY_DN11030_c0_g1_i2.p1  ORF type:complete len:349 (-),score=103.59 TRINITY_DN11030_c0_g1_i2:88-1134(-)
MDAPGLPEEFKAGSKSQRMALAMTLPLLKKCVERLRTVDTGAAITLADYGSVDGVNSYDTFHKLLGLIRAEYPRKPITVVFNGDDNTLFTSVTSQWSELEQVFYLMCGTSFFLPLLPPRTVAIGISGTAFHRCSTVACTLTAHIDPAQGQAGERAKWEAQMAKDWVTILTHRTAELALGGFLVFSVPAQNSQGQSPFRQLFDDLNTVLGKFVSDKRLTREEYSNIVIPSFPRTRDQFLAPFHDKVFVCAGGSLSLESESIQPIANSLFIEANKSGQLDRNGFSRSYMMSVHVWLGNFLFQTLSDERAPQQKEALIAEIFQQLERLVGRNAEKYEFDFVVMNMVLCRIA